MRKWMWLLSLLIITLTSPLSFAAEKAILLTINGAIGPATEDYIKRGIEYAVENHAAIIIIQLNTPGGLESAMREIDEDIITSPLPIATYVAPAGARAASAGTFIVYASHFAAMAPGTNIGAATPINLSGASTTKKLSTEEKKATNDAAAYIRSIAQLRGRNADWGELAVRQAASLSAQEAKQLKVIDDIADNYPQLLQKMDGHKVLVLGAAKELKTQHLQIESMLPDWRYDFLSFLTNPNVAYILMLIAIYGLFFEFSNPGLILPGVAGVISLLLVLYAFQLMAVNYVGLTLILIGVLFMLFEAYVASFGVLGIGGVIAFIIGSIMLFDIHEPNVRLAWTLILSTSLLTLAFFFMIISLAIKSHKRAVITGQEGLIGSEGVVLSVMNEQVIVRILGEIWDARSSVMLNSGDKIKVIKVRGLTLFVEPVEINQRKHAGE